jgi:hypothetical protein
MTDQHPMTNPDYPDYRALCDELLDVLEGGRLLWKNGYAHWVITPDVDPLCQRARAALDQPEPLTPTAWMYQSEPDFDGTHWRENWETTLDEKLARYMAGKKEPIPLWRRPGATQ